MKKPALLLGLLVACGGDDGGGPQIITPDAPGAADAPAANCQLAAELGSPTPAQVGTFFAMSSMAQTPDNYWAIAPLNDEMPTPDAVLVDLYEGFGAFENGFPTAPTTVQLTGDETSLDSCGACVQAFPGESEDAVYFATAGTLQLAEVSQTKLEGMLTNVTFTHVNIDEQSLATTPHPDGCTAALTSFSFSGTPMMPPSNVAGSPQRWRLHLKKLK